MLQEEVGWVWISGDWLARTLPKNIAPVYLFGDPDYISEPEK